MARDYSTSPTDHQRRPEHKRDDGWIRTYLHEAKVGHIASTSDDQPFLNPSTFWYDEANQRIIFHSNIAGRVRANIERNPKVCLEASEMGKLLPSNVALEFSLQYRSVIIFGTARILEDPDEQRAALTGLIKKYFPEMEAGREYRPITDKELKRTSVYTIEIESWSGKENWEERADQSDEWLALGKEWFE
ncbi:MAG: pyridoxamine 5'-phosphate oxidase family protein [Anaerolineales bacterium]|jgi:nitroimidazol reductase NimA-like FMN-containing flavoprotein (pyridoxamine 5'-phosphate oxidase superfamily)